MAQGLRRTAAARSRRTCSRLENGIGGCCDAAGQRARQAVGEIARGMAGEMAEKLRTEIAGHPDEGGARDPAGDPPEQIIPGDEQREKQKGGPRPFIRMRAARHGVDQTFDAILGADRAGHSGEHRQHDEAVRHGPARHIAPEQRDRSVPVTADIPRQWLKFTLFRIGTAGRRRRWVSIRLSSNRFPWRARVRRKSRMLRCRILETFQTKRTLPCGSRKSLP